jgi:DTW domain-containing protein YfiP
VEEKRVLNGRLTLERIQRLVREKAESNVCAVCWHGAGSCVCDKLPPLRLGGEGREFHILMHPSEFLNAGDDAKVLLGAAPGATSLYISGLEEDEARLGALLSKTQGRGVVCLFPGPDAITTDVLMARCAAGDTVRAVGGSGEGVAERSGAGDGEERGEGKVGSGESIGSSIGKDDTASTATTPATASTPTTTAAPPMTTADPASSASSATGGSTAPQFPLDTVVQHIIVLDGTWSQARSMRRHLVKLATDTVGLTSPVTEVQLNPASLDFWTVERGGKSVFKRGNKTRASQEARKGAEDCQRICTIEALALLLLELGEDREAVTMRLIAYVEANNSGLPQAAPRHPPRKARHVPRGQWKAGGQEGAGAAGGGGV